MIIRTFSVEETAFAQNLRNLTKSIGMEAILVPFGVDELFITISKDMKDLMVIASACEGVELDVAKGFETVEECWDYARKVALIAGLPEDSIEADVFEEVIHE